MGNVLQVVPSEDLVLACGILGFPMRRTHLPQPNSLVSDLSPFSGWGRNVKDEKENQLLKDIVECLSCRSSDPFIISLVRGKAYNSILERIILYSTLLSHRYFYWIDVALALAF